MDYQQLLADIAERYHQLLGENLVGIYIHGSIAFGCFHWDRSDIDFIVVVDKPVPLDIKLRLFQVLVDLRTQAPPKGFEMSVVLRKHCRDFIYPTPYELHFSNDCVVDFLDKPNLVCNDDYKVDYDLAAHFTVIANMGVVLCGEPINDVFGAVPKGDYLDSIHRDIVNAVNDVVHAPVYVILNLCRVYAYVKDRLVLSKEAGGRWGLENLPQQYHGLVASMLENYIGGEPLIKDDALLAGFCEYMIGLIFV